jgi:uncharacterized protein with HEPN domain
MKDYKLYLKDILNAIARIDEFVDGIIILKSPGKIGWNAR